MEDKRVKDVWDEFTEDQKTLIKFIVHKAIEEKEARIAHLELYILIHELAKED